MAIPLGVVTGDVVRRSDGVFLSLFVVAVWPRNVVAHRGQRGTGLHNVDFRRFG